MLGGSSDALPLRRISLDQEPTIQKKLQTPKLWKRLVTFDNEASYLSGRAVPITRVKVSQGIAKPEGRTKPKVLFRCHTVRKISQDMILQ